mmetsp:Transcript_31636/g.98546  ORF Transcript_31636/g.98546 Transcript_31636/m.98546 type:complete len:154 (-) Transcript_31636:117-578(-)
MSKAMVIVALFSGLLASPGAGASDPEPCAPGGDRSVCAALKEEVAAGADYGLQLHQLRASKASTGDAETSSLQEQRREAERRLAEISQAESKAYFEAKEGDKSAFRCVDIYCADDIGTHCCEGVLASIGRYGICCGSTGSCSHGSGGMAICTR